MLQEDIEKRIQLAEKRLSLLEQKQSSSDDDRVKQDLIRKKIYNYRIVRVVGNYYDQPLEFRANLLKCNTSQLCKSIVFENTACDHFDVMDITNSRYYLVIVQYEAKLDSELLRDLIHSLRPLDQRLPKKRFNFRLANESKNEKLTGYSHNAVCPFGLRQQLPVVICQRVVEVIPNFIYLGGGEVDLKLGLTVTDLIQGLNPIIGLISHRRLI